MVSVVPIEYIYLIGFLGALFFLSRPVNNYAKKIPRAVNKPTDPGGIKFNITIDKEDLKNKDTMEAVQGLMQASAPAAPQPKQATGQLGMLQSLMQMPGMMKSIEGAVTSNPVKGAVGKVRSNV